MIKQSKFVKTAIAAAALGFVAFGAQAATISVAPAKIAAEVFGGSSKNDAVKLPTISIASAVAIPQGSTVTVAVQLTGARFAVALTPSTVASSSWGGGANTIQTAATTFPSATTYSATITPTFGTTRATATAVDASAAAATDTVANADVVYVTLVTTQQIGIGGNLLTINNPSVTAANLGTVGSTVTVSATVLVGGTPSVVKAVPVPTSGVLDTAAATTAATSVQGVTLTAEASKSSQKINVSASKPSALFSSTGTASSTDTGSTTKILLGTLGLVNTTDAVDADGTPYTVANKGLLGINNNKIDITVTAPSVGYFAALEDAGVVELRLAPSGPNFLACSGTLIAASSAFPDADAAAAASKVTLDQVAAPATTGGSSPTPHQICLTVKGNKVIQPGAATITATLGGKTSAAQDSAETLGSTGLLSLSNNGATADVASYYPGALSAYGYSTYLRVVNTGAVSAPVSIAVINPSTGVAGTPNVLATLPAGAATTFTAAQVEAVIGTLDITARPRLRLTAPTGGLQVQSFIQSPNGTFTEVSGVTASK